MASKKAVGYCGIFCGSCEVYRAWREKDQKALAWEASESGLDVNEIRCEGCRSKVRMSWCKECVIRDCAKKRKVESCAFCSNTPCDKLIQFSSSWPHHAVVLFNLNQIRRMGMDEWVATQESAWSCPHCGKPFSFYQEQCPSCDAQLHTP